MGDLTVLREEVNGLIEREREREREKEMEKEKFAELRKAVDQVQLVDGHAHNIVDLNSTFPFKSCFTQSEGDALPYTIHTLSFKRSLRDIAELYELPRNSSLHTVEEYRRSKGLESITSTCFEAARISTILIDDGIKLDKMHDIEWHRRFATVDRRTLRIERILRIERLAEKILDEGMLEGSTWTLDIFTKTFVGKLKSVADGIVGLKSIAAYRSGLEINTKVTREDAEKGLTEVLQAEKPVCITNKSLIDYIFKLSLGVALSFDLPMQIHMHRVTNFGDKDLDLRLSNPLNLRTLLDDERFSKSRIVLLHASYPFSKEASYLASVYPQVYLDFGLAIPKLSGHGMISSVKELLELAPIKKVMFSTDGCAFPETYFLGAKEAREVAFSVLCDACNAGDLSVDEAVDAAKDIFAQNATDFYKLHFPSRGRQ